MELFKETIGLRNKKDRPLGKISSEGKYEEMLEKAKLITNELSQKEGIVGISLCGGLSRGYADELSEIDLNVYLEDNIYHEWISGMGPVPHSDALWKGNYVDFDFLSYQIELKENWSLFKKWDISYNVILFDPKKRIFDLFNEKDIFSPHEKFEYASECFEKCMYIGDLVIKQWLKRGDPLAANQLISNAVSGLIGMVFLANDEYPAYDKWALNYSYSLRWLPQNWKKRISQIILTKEISIMEAERRHELFVSLYKDCWEKIFGKELRNFELIDIITLKELQFLVDNSPLLMEKFAERFNIKHLSYEPLYKFTDIIIKNNQKLVVFKKEKFINQKDENFPDILEWSKPLLNKLVLN
ncbi:MAG: DUF4037 domain-containing protein [Candidatus Hermodarchaeota archaeon]